jgi:hypothetical protein
MAKAKFKANKSKNLNRTRTIGNTHLTYNNGRLDEIRVFEEESKKCTFHLEWMHDNTYWMRICGDQGEVQIDLKSEAKIELVWRGQFRPKDKLK